MSYTKTTWVNNTTPINETNLNKIESGIKNNDINIGEENYDNTKTYEVGDIVRYNEKIYKCITAITTAENFDISKWEQTNIVEIVQSEKSKIYELIEAISTPIVGEGENITLNDTAEKRFENFDIEGNSKQETRSGKNLLNFNGFATKEISGVTITNNNDGSITLNGTATATISIRLSNQMNKTLTAGNYYFSSNSKGSVSGAFTTFMLGNNDAEDIKFATITEENKGFSTSIDYKKYWLWLYINSGITFTNYIMKPQLEAGTVKTNWELYGAMPSPNYPSEIKTVGSNVNLFDKDDEQYILKNMFIDGSSKKISSYTGTYSIALPIKPNTTYTIYKGLGIKDSYRVATSDNNVLGSSINNLSSFIDTKYYTIKTSNESKYLIIWYYWDSKETYTEEEIRNSIKIVEGTEIGEYSPYGQGCINEVICNKNLAIKNVKGYFSISDFKIKIDNNSESFLFYAEKGKEYTRSCKVNLDRNRIGKIDTLDVTQGMTVLNGQEINSKKFICDDSGIYIWFVNSTLNDSIKESFQIEESSTESTFVQHEEQSYIIPIQQSFKSIGDTRDTFIKKNNKWYERHNIARIESYNGETITSEYISNTGELSTGATVDYISDTPVDIECTEEQSTILFDIEQNAKTYKGVTHIYSNDAVSPNCYVEAAKDLTTLIQ